MRLEVSSVDKCRATRQAGPVEGHPRGSQLRQHWPPDDRGESWLALTVRQPYSDPCPRPLTLHRRVGSDTFYVCATAGRDPPEVSRRVENLGSEGGVVAMEPAIRSDTPYQDRYVGRNARRHLVRAPRPQGRHERGV